MRKLLSSAIFSFLSHLVLVAKSLLSLMCLQKSKALSFVLSAKMIGIFSSTPWLCMWASWVVASAVVKTQLWLISRTEAPRSLRPVACYYEHKEEDAQRFLMSKTNAWWRMGSSIRRNQTAKSIPWPTNVQRTYSMATQLKNHHPTATLVIPHQTMWYQKSTSILQWVEIRHVATPQTGTHLLILCRASNPTPLFCSSS